MPAREGCFSVIGADVEITGDVAATGDLHVDGQITGDVSCQVLLVGKNGRITGAIRAQTARIAGTVDGAIDADTLTIESTARTTGDISYDQLAMEVGAQTHGRLSHKSGSAATGLSLVTGAAEWKAAE